MFNLFNNYFEFRGAMFIPGWIPDLSQGVSLYVLGFSLPFLGNHLRLLPVIYVISQLLFGKITQSTAAAGANATQMKIMTMGMPLFSFLSSTMHQQVYCFIGQLVTYCNWCNSLL